MAFVLRCSPLNRALGLVGGNMNKSEIKEFSLITYFFERLFYFLQYLSLVSVFLKTRSVSQENFADEQVRVEVTKKRGRYIEYYIITWIVLIIPLCVYLVSFDEPFIRYIVVFLSIYRLGEIVVTAINMNLFDGIRLGNKPHYVSGATRTVLLVLINYIELIILFAIIYSSALDLVKGASDFMDSLYFSVITQLTIGYGEITPLGTLRFVAAAQGFIGFIFGILVLSRFVSLLSNIKVVQSDGK